MSIKLLDTIYNLTDNADKVDGKHASDFALSSHGVHWEGFTRRANTSATWGTLISSNGYTPLFWMDSTSGGGVAFSDAGGQTFMQIDGYFYQNEGRYLVLDTNNFSTYAAPKSHTHDDRYFTESEINTKLGNYLPLTGGNLSGNLSLLDNTGSYRRILIGNASGTNTVIHNSAFIGSSRETSISLYEGTTHLGSIGVKSYPFYVDSSATVHTLLHSNNYTSYTVTKTGSGASGTWGINISGNSATATYASLLSKQGGTSTGVATWNPLTSFTKVWGQKFTDTNISSDTGDILYYLRKGSAGSSTELCICIDGDYYAMGNSGTPEKVLHGGNSSVSKSGETLTVTINGVTQSLTNTNTNTWRGITNTYTGSDQSTSVSQYGTNALYNALVNGYASSAGNADTLDGYHASSFALSHSHNYHPLGGSWKPSSLSSYTRHWGWAYSSAEAGMASNGAEMQIYTDGKFWQREGAYYCLDNGNTYVTNGYGVINGSTITAINYASTAGSADFASLLTKQGGTSTSIATWDPKSSWTKVWGQRFINNSISSDSGDVLYYLRSSTYSSGGTELCVCIDGDYYAGTGQYKVIHEGNISSYIPASSTNADTVDGYHASSLWRSDGGTWNPSANIALNATANGQEWSFDITRNGKTGCYWHVWDSSLGSCLRVDADNGKVTACYSFNCASLQIGGETITFTT